MAVFLTLDLEMSSMAFNTYNLAIVLFLSCLYEIEHFFTEQAFNL